MVCWEREIKDCRPELLTNQKPIDTTRSIRYSKNISTTLHVGYSLALGGKEPKDMSKILKQSSRVRVANNFIRDYGKFAFQNLLTGLQNKVSGQKLAAEYGVTRERIRQWKDTFGETEHVFYPYEGVIAVLEGTQELKEAKLPIRHFVKKYKMTGFRRFINDLQDGKSGEVIGKHFDISRQRVQQIKNNFGRSKTTYTVYPDVNALR